MEARHNQDHGRDNQKKKKNTNKARGNTRSSGGTPSSLRWKPTNDQVDLLEGLYRQGMRTPSADQVQQITERLSPFGNIEGKNVFYWFQNHKARLRLKQKQKQKQETVAYINRHSVDHGNRSANTSHLQNPCTSTSNLIQFACPNTVGGQYLVPIQTQVAEAVGPFPQQYNQNKPPKKESTASPRRPHKLEAFKYVNRVLPGIAVATYTVDESRCIAETNNRETLALFPLTPTGILQGKDHDDHHVENSDDRDRRLVGRNSSNTSRCYTASTSSGLEDGRAGDRTFYDFFSS